MTGLPYTSHCLTDVLRLSQRGVISGLLLGLQRMSLQAFIVVADMRVGILQPRAARDLRDTVIVIGFLRRFCAESAEGASAREREPVKRIQLLIWVVG